MIFNTEYINAIIEIHSIQAAYLNGRELPPVAKRLIEIGKEKGVEIEITYGINCENENIIAGYWIQHHKKTNKYSSKIFTWMMKQKTTLELLKNGCTMFLKN